MRGGHFKAAWSDVVSSPGWFSKVLLLALVSIIPVFGSIVALGYLYGWARDAAWGVRAPLPDRIFSNPDGMLYRRGLFCLVIIVVAAVLPFLVVIAASVVFAGASVGTGLADSLFGWQRDALRGVFSNVSGVLVFAAWIAVVLFSTLMQWLGCIRMSIYGRLSAGLQLGRLWAMARHDFGGLLRLFVGSFLLAVVARFVYYSAVLFVLLSLATAFAAVFLGGLVPAASSALACVVFLVAVFVIALVLGVSLKVLDVLVDMLVIRALGHWTCQFDVPRWRGQDDPFPFELREGGSAA